MSSAVESDARRAQQVNSARKKLKQFRASRTLPASHSSSPSHTSRTSSVSSSSATVLNHSTADNTFPRRSPSGSHAKAILDAVADTEAVVKMDTMSRHARQASRHQRQRSSMTLSWPPQIGGGNLTPRPSVVGLFDVPPLDPSDGAAAMASSDVDQSDNIPLSREIVTTPATPSAETSTLPSADEEGAVVARLNAFSFGSKPDAGKPALLPSFSLRETSSRPAGRPPSMRLSRSLSPLDFLEASPRDSLSAPSPSSQPTSPQPGPPTRRRHSHNRSESISLPNLKLGRPASLGLPSPGFPSTPSSPMGDFNSRGSRLSTPQSGSRLKFEPSDKEKEESRRRALDKLTGGGGTTPKAREREEPKAAEISLPSFDDDEQFSTSSSRPPSDALTSTASSSRPSSFTFGSSSSFNSLSASPLPWSQFDENQERYEQREHRWSFGHSHSQSFGQRFDPKDDAPVFEMSGPTKTSSVLLNTSSLGVLTEEDETESDADDEATSLVSTTSSMAEHETPDSTPAGPTPSRLRELHLVSSVSSQGSNRRSSNPDILRSMAQARETPTKGSNYGTIGRGRPRPLALDTNTATSYKNAALPSPSKGPRPQSLNLGRPRPRSSISYKKDDSGSASGSSHDYASSRGFMSPPTIAGEISSPPSLISPLAEWNSMSRPSTRPCPRPRSAILGGTSGRVLGEVDEEGETDRDQWPQYGEDSISTGRPSTEASRDSYDWPATARRDSRDRIDAELERDALREDVDLWRKRCRGLEERLESERREGTILRDRVRKLGDRLLAVSAASSAMSPAKEREASQSRLIAEMRDQLFSLTAALERERREKNDALLHLAELQAAYDGARTPQVVPNSLPTTPKSRPRKHSSQMFGTPPDQKYADADFMTPADEAEPVAVPTPDGDDKNWSRMRGFAFPSGPVEKSDNDRKRESFFGLSRPRAVRAAPSIGGLGLDWASGASPTMSGFDLPPIEVNEANRDLIRPASLVLKNKRASRLFEREQERHDLQRDEQHETMSRQTRQPPPTRPLPTPSIEITPERQTASAFGLGFLSGYLPLARTTPPNVPRVFVTPSSVSPKKQPLPLPLERELMTHYVAPAGDIDFRHSCRRCTGEIIEL